jgi:CRISP-associated protein Cas1
MDRIVDIATDKRHLSRYRGFLIVSEDHTELGRVPLDDILAVVVHANGVTYSNSLLAELARRGALLIVCGANHAPLAIVTPIEGHHAQAGRIQAQWNAKQPLSKQLWKTLVIAKIKMQAAALNAFGQNAQRLNHLTSRVKSGDPENIEAQAARHYWPLLMGSNFRRDRQAAGVNGLLNYGYTVLRASVARAIVASGLHPSIGLHHRNKLNAFALADDLMEPFRPLVDCAVLGLMKRGINEVAPEAKSVLAGLIALDLDLGKSRSPMTTALNSLCFSLAQSFESGKSGLILPKPPSPLELIVLGGADGST